MGRPICKLSCSHIIQRESRGQVFKIRLRDTRKADKNSQYYFQKKKSRLGGVWVLYYVSGKLTILLTSFFHSAQAESWPTVPIVKNIWSVFLLVCFTNPRDLASEGVFLLRPSCIFMHKTNDTLTIGVVGMMNWCCDSRPCDCRDDSPRLDCWLCCDMFCWLCCDRRVVGMSVSIEISHLVIVSSPLVSYVYVGWCSIILVYVLTDKWILMYIYYEKTYGCKVIRKANMVLTWAFEPILGMGTQLFWSISDPGG